MLMIAAGRDHIADVRFERLLRDELAGYGVRVTLLSNCPGPIMHSRTSPPVFTTAIALWYVHRFLDAALK